MDATTLELPDDVDALKQRLQQREAQLAEQLATIEQLQRINEGLTHRLDLALRRIYGRSAEKIDPKQLLLFGRTMQQAAQTMEALAEARQAPSTSPKRKGHGRRPLSPDLPRHRVEHPIPPFRTSSKRWGRA